MTLNTFSKLETFLGRKAERRVSGIRSTTVIRLHDDNIGVQYHSTLVVIAHRDGTFELFTGGYHTATTKDRINSFSSARIYQKDFSWFLGVGGAHTDSVPFREGMFVTADGSELFTPDRGDFDGTEDYRDGYYTHDDAKLGR